jgi:GDP-mannose 6-dehydrogenase
VKVAVFGLGYVGTITASCLAANGHDVWGVDLDRSKAALVASGRSPVIEPSLDEVVQRVVAEGQLHATTSVADALERADVSLLCVGTPSTEQGAANLSYVFRVIDDLARALQVVEPPPSGFHAVAMRSTVPPGTVDELGGNLRSLLGSRGPRIGVAMCPEFLREGTGITDFYFPPFTVIGSEDGEAVELLQTLLGFIDRPCHVVDTRTAEGLKYACNAFHATKVSFVNELGRVFRNFDVDTRKVMELFCLDDQLNISSKYLRPGFAFGGSCLPKDLRSLLQLARTESIDLPLLSGVLQTNDLSITNVVERVIRGPGRNVALLGLCFKPGSDDLRESPYVDLAETLLGKGYQMRIYDPVINPSALIGANRQYIDAKLPHLGRILTESPEEALHGADVALVPFSSPEVVGALLRSTPPRIIDLNGRLGPEPENLAGYEGVSW